MRKSLAQRSGTARWNGASPLPGAGGGALVLPSSFVERLEKLFDVVAFRW